MNGALSTAAGHSPPTGHALAAARAFQGAAATDSLNALENIMQNAGAVRDPPAPVAVPALGPGWLHSR